MMEWHRLFGLTLTDYFTGSSYSVELEKDLSLKQQFLDVVIIEKKNGALPPELPDGFENLAAHNLVTYKSLRESLDEWTMDELVGHYVNYRKQISPSLKELLSAEKFRLYAVSTLYPKNLAKQINFIPAGKGIYDVTYGLRKIRIIVTSRISEKKRNAPWLLFSGIPEKVRYGAEHYTGNLGEMSSIMNQLFVKYKAEGVVAVPYTIEDYRRDYVLEYLDRLTPAEILKRFSADDRLKGLSSDDRLKGLSADELLKRLSPEEIKAYLKKLKRKKKSGKL
ncbi:MAG: hypothetical protein BWK80_57250 [Desulfobacteraceae bacterium IS3]|nr:MAG: hypothetical protein BWK80_57250 [Desulfobacteraceae bacterium IS3]